jgi:hypothetical protein
MFPVAASPDSGISTPGQADIPVDHAGRYATLFDHEKAA